MSNSSHTFLALAAGVAWVAFLALGGRAHAASDVFGFWIEPDMGAVVKLYPCDENLCGRLVRLPAGRPKTDVNNPDPVLRSRALEGLQVIEGFRREAPGAWVGGGDNGRVPGRIYVPLNGDTLGDASNSYAIRLDGQDRLTVGLQACVITCMMNSVWQRLPADATLAMQQRARPSAD